jgi:hypothetical protein
VSFAAREVALAPPQQRDAAVVSGHSRGGPQPGEGRLLPVVGGPGPQHLRQPPDVVMGVPGGQRRVERRPGGVGVAVPRQQVGEQRQPVRHAGERAFRPEVADAAADQFEALLASL